MSCDGGSPGCRNRGKQQLVAASDITDADVLCGRGRAVHIHIGNIRFRELVLERAAAYHQKPDDKPFRRQTALDVIRAVQSNGGRFLKPVNAAKNDLTAAAGGVAYPVARSGDWEIADLATSITKVKQALRDAGSNNDSSPEKQQQGASSKRVITEWGEELQADNSPEESKSASGIAQVPGLSSLRQQASLSSSILDEFHRMRSEEQDQIRAKAHGHSASNIFDQWHGDRSQVARPHGGIETRHNASGAPASSSDALRTSTRISNPTAVRLDSLNRLFGNTLQPSFTSYGPSSLISDNQWSSINTSPRIDEMTREQELGHLLGPARTVVAAPPSSDPLDQYLDNIRIRWALAEQQRTRQQAISLSDQRSSSVFDSLNRSDLFGQPSERVPLDVIQRLAVQEQHRLARQPQQQRQQLALDRPRPVAASGLAQSMNYSSLLLPDQPNTASSPLSLFELLHHGSSLPLVPGIVMNTRPEAPTGRGEMRIPSRREAHRVELAATSRAERDRARGVAKRSSPSKYDDGKSRGGRK